MLCGCRLLDRYCPLLDSEACQTHCDFSSALLEVIPAGPAGVSYGYPNPTSLSVRRYTQCRCSIEVVAALSNVAVRAPLSDKYATHTEATLNGHYAGASMTPVACSPWKRVSGRCRSSNVESSTTMLWYMRQM